jgi:hypothetical protein
MGRVAEDAIPSRTTNCKSSVNLISIDDPSLRFFRGRDTISLFSPSLNSKLQASGRRVSMPRDGWTGLDAVVCRPRAATADVLGSDFGGAAALVLFFDLKASDPENVRNDPG